MWQSEFQGLLRIRFASHHAKCSLCIKHRLLIKKLGHCPAASRAQRLMLQKHLQRQHADRQVYYAARARSRLAALTLGMIEVTAILDSMDAAKHAWPRSPLMNSKEFSSFNRPRLTSTTLLVHGYMRPFHPAWSLQEAQGRQKSCALASPSLRQSSTIDQFGSTCKRIIAARRSRTSES